MRKFWYLLFILAILPFAGCRPAATPGAAIDPKAPATEDASLPKMTCSVVSLVPTPGPTEVSLFPAPGAEDWIQGKDSAILTIVEYSDLQCPYCAQLAIDLAQFYEQYPDEVRIIFRHFPLPSHNLALPAAYASEAAGAQGKFWEMHDILFTQQATWSLMADEQFNEWLASQVKALGLDMTKFNSDLASEAVINKVNAAQERGQEIGIPGTPFMLINGQPYQGPRDIASLESILKLFRMEKRQYTYCPPMQIDPKKQYIATIQSEKGDVKIQLFPDKAPMAVNSFVFLARNGWFNDITFHRVLADFVVQAGDPSGTGFGGPGYSFENEISDLAFNKEGLVGMANSGPGTNGSQFFITLAAADTLTGNYTIFGEVIEGMDVLKSLTVRDPQQADNLPPGDKITTITILEK